MSLRILTLGPPRIILRGNALAELPTQRLRCALLIYLATERDVSRETVLSMFWPERDAARGKHALRQMLYELRQLLGDDWLDQQRDRLLVRAAVDAHDFDHAVAAQHVDAALSLYNGEFLAGFTLDNHAFDAWVERQRVQYGRRHRKLRREHVTALLAEGRTEAALKSAQRWVELDPLEDEANHALIQCLALSGQRVAALQTYESYERQLAAELQVEPLEETRALVERIRAGEPIEPAAPAVAAVPTIPADSAAAVPEETGDVAQPDVAQSTLLLSAPGSHAALPPGRASQRRVLLLRSGAVVAAGLAMLALFALVTRSGSNPASDPPVTRVVVLPFTDNSDDGSLIPLANALTEALARSLAQAGPLEVVSPSGLAALREQGLAIDSLRRMFGGDFVITGSIDTTGQFVAMNVELLDGRNGSLLRTETVQRLASESRLLVDDVVDRTAGILRREVGQRVAVRRARMQTNSEEAWRLVLEARTQQDRLVRLFRHNNLDAIEQALDRADSLLARAAELDRRWSEPVVMRGWIMERRAVLATFSAREDSAARRKGYEAARSLAQTAMQRDSEDPRAWELRGNVERQLAMLPGIGRDSVAARLLRSEQDLRRAAQLDPFSVTAWRGLAETQAVTGRYAEAKNSAERAWEIDRYAQEATTIINTLFSTSLELGEDAEARRWCEEGRRLHPTAPPFVFCLFVLHAWVDSIRPDPAMLRAEMARLSASSEVVQPQLIPRLELMLAVVYARAGQMDSARVVFERGRGGHGTVWLEAAALAALREDDLAVQKLRQHLVVNTPDRVRTARGRPFWKLRGHPQYEALFEQN